MFLQIIVVENQPVFIACLQVRWEQGIRNEIQERKIGDNGWNARGVRNRYHLVRPNHHSSIRS